MKAKMIYLLISIILCVGEPTFEELSYVLAYHIFALTNLIASTVIILKSKKSWK